MKILVTGGAGYIGSFMTRRLLEDSHEVIVLDSLERGHEEYIDSRAHKKIGNLLDKNFVESVFADENYDGIIHFAGYISMGESMEQPHLYFENNFFATLNLLEGARKRGVNKIIFSSTAGTYGNPAQVPIPESHPKNPENPYGESKLMVEKLLSWYQKIHGLNFAALRYFNACGAEIDGGFGENHEPETHIIPNAIRAVLNNSEFTLFGNDYQTPDGTCVRDYIHIKDLVEAHVLAFNKLQNTGGGFYYNVGTGKGYSNKEVIEMVEKVSGKKLQVHASERRPGDADKLVADCSAISTELNFSTKYSDLETIVTSAWKWHSTKA